MEAGFDTMETYIWRRHNTVAQYIATLLLLDLCKAAERNQGARVEIQWWEQAEIDLSGERETEVEAEAAYEGMDGLEEKMRGVKTEGSWSWFNGNDYKVAQLIK